MRLGILADIHEQVSALRACLQWFDQEGVDQVLLLGDIAETGADVAETIEVLEAVKPVGVFGNHDLGFCHHPTGEFLQRYPDSVFTFFSQLQPTYTIGDCLFVHGAPWWDPFDPVEYYIGEYPYTDATLAQWEDECPGGVVFMGHFHHWKAAVGQQVMSWDGGSPLRLSPQHRYLITIHAVLYGHCAIFDDDAALLIPHRV